MTFDGKQVLRGLAAVSPERRREIASMGGKAVKNRYYSVNRQAAVDSGRKGGASVPSEKRTFSRYPELVKRLADEKREARKRKLEELQSNLP